MRWNILFGCILLSGRLLGQIVSGQSEPIVFKIPAGGSSQSMSAPITLKVRQDISFFGVSSPTTFNIGHPQKTETIGQDNRSVESNDPKATIPELDRNLPKYYSLIIGVSDYQFNNARLQDLNKAVEDAAALQKMLTGNFNFQRENSISLVNPNRQEIIRELEKLADEINDKDNLLIFYAGHGVWDERLKVGYWLPADAKTEDKSSWISNSTIRDYIAGINSKHTLIITDACFSGSIFKTRDLKLTDYAMSNLYRLPSRKAMTSGTLTTVPDESRFMQYLLKRLNDTEGKYISARQLFYGLETAVLNNSNTVPQFGVIQDTGDEGGDFIFIRRQKE